MPIINDHHVSPDDPMEYPRHSASEYSGITVLVCAILGILLLAGNLHF